MIRFISISAILGFIISVLLTLTWAWFGWYGKLSTLLHFLFWPSSIFVMVSAAESINYTWLSISIGLNVFLYAVVGYFIWLGLNKYHWLLYILTLCVALAWYKIIRWLSP